MLRLIFFDNWFEFCVVWIYVVMINLGYKWDICVDIGLIFIFIYDV